MSDPIIGSDQVSYTNLSIMLVVSIYVVLIMSDPVRGNGESER